VTDERTVAVLREAVVALAWALTRFGRHLTICSQDPCICGFSDAKRGANLLEEIQMFASEHPGQDLPKDLARRVMAMDRR